jgi:alkyl hydroperoxide reductase subunit F
MQIYDLAILGGGPAGVGAGIYASRKKLKTVLLTDKFGGQSAVSPNIQNWIGVPSISGEELAKNLKEHLLSYVEDVVSVKEGEKVELVSKDKSDEKKFIIKTNKETYKAKTVLITTGSHRKKLKAIKADELEHRGITYCATCDGPLFSGQDVVVIGGGNAGFETASQLLAYAKTVTLLHHKKQFTADPVTVKRVSENSNITLINNAETTEILGDKSVTGLRYKDTKTGEEKELKTGGVFVEIGNTPTTSFVKNLVNLNDYGYIIIDSKTQKTSTEGVWAAGDCTDGLYHQNNIAVGDAIKALEDIYLYLKVK